MVFKFSLSLLVVLSFILLWQKLSNPSCFPVKNIKISGDLTYVKKSHLQQIILPFLVRGFFRLDSQGLKEKISHEPWIANVTLKRFWPDTLIVNFVTKKPIAFIGEYGIVDDKGNIFISDSEKSKGLDLPIYNTMKPLLAKLNLRIKVLKLAEQHYLYLKLSNGLSVYLSRSQPYIELKRLIDVYSDVIASKVSMVDYVDLRYVHGMAVKFKKYIS